MRNTLLAIVLWLLPATAVANGVPIEKIDVDVEIDGRLATTNVRHILRNDTNRRQSARFRVSIPDEAAVTRLAMSIEGEMIEGEVVPRARARQIYDEIVRARRDPALLEWQAPGEYTLEIFPIEPGERKRIVLEYCELLGVKDGSAHYEFTPIGRDRNVEKYEVDIVSTSPVTARSPQLAPLDTAPDRLTHRTSDAAPFAFAASVEAAPQTRVSVDRRHFLADVAVDLPHEDAAERNIVLAVDRSASTPDLEAARRIADLLAAQPHRALRVVHGSTQALSCDVSAGASSKIVDACFTEIERRGATDLSALVGLAASEAAALGGDTDIVLVTDGRITHGAKRASDVAASVQRVAGTALHVAVVGEQPRRGWLQLLADRGRGHLVDATDAEVDANLLASRNSPKLWAASSGRGVMSQPWVGAGSRLVVLGSSRRPRPELVLERGAQKRPIAVELAGAARVRGLDKLWARAKLRDLEQRAADTALEKFSIQHGVMSRATSYLVLENAEAYERHGIKRRKQRARRAEPTMHRTAPPRIRMASVVVSGSLDKQIISRAINKRLGAIRGCYEDTLRTHPGLAGLLTVEFAIERGRTLRVGVHDDDLDSGPLQDCVLDEFRTLRFPVPSGGGLVTVRYPLRFTTPHPAATPTGPTATSVELAMLLRQEKREDADALLQRSLRKYAANTAASSTLRLRLFAMQTVRDAYPDEFVDAATVRLQHPTPPRGLITTLTVRLLDDRRVPELLAVPPPPHRMLRWMLTRAARSVSVPVLRKVYKRWATGASPRLRLDAIVGDRVLEVALASDVVVATLAAAQPDDDAIDAMARVATVTPWKEQAAAFVIARCADDPPSSACLQRLRLLRGIADVRDALRRQHARRIAHLEAVRRERYDADVLAELSELVAEIGERRRAVDLAWEIVEHAPHSDAGRQRALQLVESFPPAK